MDAMDWALLAELQRDARLSYSELARRVHMSAPAVAERVRRLEESGVIIGYHARVDPALAGRGVAALIRMSCYGPRCVLRDEQALAWPEILEVHRVTGDTCCLLRVAAFSMTAFEELIDRLAPYGHPSSMMVLSSPVPWRPLSPPGVQ
ncbi:Lrp/AsnC family transcriptional regulator [Streptosporangium album]|nr:Lrp/AsnC family transcriptional regulator [Streptosporangium album]